MMFSRSLRSVRFGFVRPCSTAAVVTQTPAPVSKSEAANAFNNIMFKGRKKNLIGIRELKFLFNACQATDAKYAGNGVDWFQEKGFDFSEELNSLFVDACLRGQMPEIAVSRLIYGKGRIGAWSTPKSLNKLFGALCEQKDAQAMVSVLETLIPKNVRVNNVTVHLCLTACCEVQSRDLYQRVVELTEGSVDKENMEKILARHPIPEEVVEEQEDEAGEESGEENTTA